MARVGLTLRPSSRLPPALLVISAALAFDRLRSLSFRFRLGPLPRWVASPVLSALTLAARAQATVSLLLLPYSVRLPFSWLHYTAPPPTPRFRALWACLAYFRSGDWLLLLGIMTSSMSLIWVAMSCHRFCNLHRWPHYLLGEFCNYVLGFLLRFLVLLHVPPAILSRGAARGSCRVAAPLRCRPSSFFAFFRRH